LAKAWNLVPALELADIQAWGRWPLSPVCRRCVQALMSGGKG
jgi:hypothetical protein